MAGTDSKQELEPRTAAGDGCKRRSKTFPSFPLAHYFEACYCLKHPRVARPVSWQIGLAPIGVADAAAVHRIFPHNLISDALRVVAHASLLPICAFPVASQVVPSRPRKELVMSEYAFVYQPQIIRETAEGLNRLDIRDEMLDQRELELMTSVDAESCAVVIRGLLHLQRQDPTAPITLYINSPGGEVQSGLALYDVMQAVSCPIRTVCLGMAASMGALLFIAGDKREILPHSRVMIHDPLIGAGAGGSALSVKARADDLMRIRDITAGVIARHSGMPIERVFELTASDTYFEAEEAVEAGLADRVVTRL